jgi:hypothetical protein
MSSHEAYVQAEEVVRGQLKVESRAHECDTWYMAAVQRHRVPTYPCCIAGVMRQSSCKPHFAMSLISSDSSFPGVSDVARDTGGVPLS